VLTGASLVFQPQATRHKMPPKHRKRVKKTPVSSSDSDSDLEPRPQLKSSKHIPASSNLKGFPSLPHELLSAIANCFPKIHTNDILANPTCVGEYSGSPDFQSRFTALRSLSQTCRNLREFYLPLLWERFQVCLASDPKGSWFRELGQAMERKSKGMLKSKYLWPYVQ
jgi:hypothetical protein